MEHLLNPGSGYFVNRLRNSESYKTIINRLKSSDGNLWLKGLYGSSRAYLLSSLAIDIPQTFLVVLPTQDESEKFVQDVITFWETKDDGRVLDVLLFPEWQQYLYEGASPSKKLVADRLRCYDRLINNQRCVIVASIKALMHRLLPKEIFKNGCLQFSPDEEIDLDEAIEKLIQSGYQRVNMVEVKGEFARRGDILDIYPLTSDEPVRIDFFGDEVDSIRKFETTSQRSISNLETIRILPARELMLTADAIDNWRQRTEEIALENSSPKFLKELNKLTDRFEEQTDLEGIEAYMPWFYPNNKALVDYLPEDVIVFFNEPLWAEREATRFFEQLQGGHDKKIELDQVSVEPHEMYDENILDALKDKRTIYSSLTAHSESAFPATKQADKQSLPHGEAEVHNVGTPIPMNMRSLGTHRGDFKLFLEEVKRWQTEGYSVYILCDNPKQMERMNDIVTDRELEVGKISVGIGILSDGFISDELRLAMMSDDEIFGRSRLRKRKVKFKEGVPILSYMDLKEDDYVVHVSHGIAIYNGIKRLKIDDKEQDFLMLQYAGSDVLYVPTYQIDLVQKYVGGADDIKLKLDRLGGVSWKRIKERVRESVRKLAKELLQLYAARQALPGHAYSPNMPWQQEFEAVFPYEETPDQLKAIEDVKLDMERARPMDRLVCGDVGYGKTEVAMRAAFKAVMDAKQVAVLTPTTVLAQQHYHTFTERFYEFPIRIEMLSRFRTPAEIKKTIEGMENGKVDIVIGTHRLLSKDVKFRALGLLVIDEEHRFGVKQKERIKQLRTQVDVLTLTATPIPRTLHMSIMGARDLSVINTPPENRLPIETYVMEYNSGVVRDAILKEMDRGGQVFFVHNRVQSIDSIAMSVQELVPQARVAVAHGQMPERRLEKIMLDFVAYKYDVLVCTTIIESGLDIPNVNTIIINRADALGLAQLYQLRGRVGRAQYRAYGYLFYPGGRAITEGAQKRLRVIEEFTDLGSGFKIALRDLEIRGTGNILGPEQHGHIVTVGYDLYCKLLEEAVKELKGEEVIEEVETKISLPIEAYLPDDYIPDSQQKVSIYKKIATLSAEAERKELENELKDRYGNIPPPVHALLEIAELKQAAQKLGIDAIVAGKEYVKITFDLHKTKIDPRKLVAVIKSNKRLSLAPPARLMIDVADLNSERLLDTIKRVLQKLT